MVFLALLLSACGLASPTLTVTTPSSITPLLEESSPPKINEPIVVTVPSNLNARLIAQVANDDGSPRPVLRDAQWIDDGTSIIYTLSTLNGERRFAYELDSGETLSLSATFAEEDNSGLVSPNGLFEIRLEQNRPTPTTIPMHARYDMVLVNTVTGQEKDLGLSTDYPEIEWSPDGTLFVLTYPSLGGNTPIYIGDSNEGTLTFLADIADHVGNPHIGLDLSPDGKKLAIVSSDTTQLQVIYLEDGRSEFAEGGNAAFFYWTADSQRVYYKALSLKSGVEFDGYYMYDTFTQEGDLLLTQERLTDEGLCLESCYFVPSPDGSQTLVGWGDYTHDYLWLIDFP